MTKATKEKTDMSFYSPNNWIPVNFFRAPSIQM